MRDKDRALKYLAKSLELDHLRYSHMERDYALDYIRNTEEYIHLIERFKNEQSIPKSENASYNSGANLVTDEDPMAGGFGRSA